MGKELEMCDLLTICMRTHNVKSCVDINRIVTKFWEEKR